MGRDNRKLNSATKKLDLPQKNEMVMEKNLTYSHQISKVPTGTGILSALPMPT